MNILAALTIIACAFIIALFGSAAFVMIGKDINEKKLKKQNELLDELEQLRNEVYEDNSKLNERMTVLSVNQQYLENKLMEILNRGE